ncbi:Synaptophysin / synaptoporin [Paragonimus heterotremus]|uniref:Synaptophysin / synaptoporin n=1 Tax=Paragonimus heterotremus TaxID=100268 RepID=A0A8J4SY54_9TREM|nr:Synaptophysin / synaptoporin [Paragonimus heterotremus]
MFQSSCNFDALKEPRGFIKFIQIFLAICAFATTCDFSTDVKVAITCSSNGTTYEESYHVFYFFRINDFTVPICNSPKRNNLFGDFSSSAQFFVFTGVSVFLYCIGVLILYVVCSETYSNSDRASKADFIASVLIAVLWFIASAAWADGVQQLKTYTDPLNIIAQVQGADRQKSKPLTFPTYGGVNASLVSPLPSRFL